MPPSLTFLDHLVLTVADLDRTLRFYTGTLNMRALTFSAADGSTRHALAFGDQKFNLHEAGSEFTPRAASAAPGTADLCFLTAQPLSEWQAHLAHCRVAIEEGPIARTGATGPIRSIYIRDPDGNLIEIATPTA